MHDRNLSVFIGGLLYDHRQMVYCHGSVLIERTVSSFIHYPVSIHTIFSNQNSNEQKHSILKLVHSSHIQKYQTWIYFGECINYNIREIVSTRFHYIIFGICTLSISHTIQLMENFTEKYIGSVMRNKIVLQELEDDVVLLEVVARVRYDLVTRFQSHSSINVVSIQESVHEWHPVSV